MERMLYRCLIALSLASAAAFAQAIQQSPAPATPQSPSPAQPASQSQPAPPPASQIDSETRIKVFAALHDRKFDEGLTAAQASLAANPNSPASNKLVGIVLLDQQKAAAALPYFEKALQLDSNDASVHLLLVQAYAALGDAKNRDAQRAILHGFHIDGKHPDFAPAPGFMVESFPVGDKTVQAFEFYEPYGNFHLYYRFNVFAPDGRLERFLALESDDADQVDYARTHPKDVAAGKRRFSLDSYQESSTGQPMQGLITFIDGLPSYDDLRARIARIVQGQVAPNATTVVTPGLSKPQQ